MSHRLEATAHLFAGDSRQHEHRFGVLAKTVYEHGFIGIPVLPRQKKTLFHRWSQLGDRCPDAAKVAAWAAKYPDHGLAILCGPVVAIDIDELDPKRNAELRDLTGSVLGKTSLIRTGREPKVALLYRADPACRIASTRVGNVDILAQGRYVVAFGIHPLTGQPYKWAGATPATLPWSELPLVTPEVLSDLVSRIAGFSSLVPAEMSAMPTRNGSHAPSPVVGRPQSFRHLQDARWTYDHNSRVVDGRDAYLASLVFGAFAGGAIGVEQIALSAFERFTATADLVRPKRNGKQPWALNDAKSKARALLKGGKPRPARSGGSVPGFWTPLLKQAFLRAVDSAGARGLLSPATVAVSRAMLSHVSGGSTCFASTVTLAAKLKLSLDTVKKARRNLRHSGFWKAVAPVGGQGRTAHYVPDPAVLGLPDPFTISGNTMAISLNAPPHRSEKVDHTATQRDQELSEVAQDSTQSETCDLSPQKICVRRKNSSSSDPASSPCHKTRISAATNAVGEAPQR